MQDDTDFLADKRKQEKACTVALVTKKRERIRELVRARNTLSIVDLATLE